LAPLHTGEPTDWQVFQKLFPNQNVIVPKEAEVEYEWDDKQLSIKWKTDVGTFGSAEIPRSEAQQPSTSQPLTIKTWKEFKE
jgi:hypothetical protein